MSVYRVEVTYVYYAEAESEDKAEECFRDVVGDQEPLDTHASPVTTKTLPPSSDGWEGDCLVYGPRNDVTLDQALAAAGLPNVAELKKLYAARLSKA